MPTAAPDTLDHLRRQRSAIYASKALMGRTGQRLEIWPSGMSPDCGEFLRDLVQREAAARTLETGLALGLSASFIIEGSLAAGMTPSHTAVDPFQKTDWDQCGRITLERLGLDRHCRFIEEDSLTALPRLVADGETFDFGFVDGGHLFDHIFCDTLYMTRLVRPGGLVVLDDLWMPASRAALAYFTSNLGLVHENSGDTSAGKRFAVFRLPDKPIPRRWDHFVSFPT